MGNTNIITRPKDKSEGRLVNINERELTVNVDISGGSKEVRLTFDVFGVNMQKKKQTIKVRKTASLSSIKETIKKKCGISSTDVPDVTYDFKCVGCGMVDERNENEYEFNEDSNPFQMIQGEGDFIVSFTLDALPNFLNEFKKPSDTQAPVYLAHPFPKIDNHEFCLNICTIVIQDMKYKPTFDYIKIYENSPQKFHLDNISSSSAFCNGNGHLYISGGKNNNYFWDFDLEKCKENKKDINSYCKIYEMPESNYLHSMIYIPNQYVFIVGGERKEIYVFDIESKVFYEWEKKLDFEKNFLIRPTLWVNENRYLCILENSEKKEEKSLYYLDLRYPKGEETIEKKLEIQASNNLACCSLPGTGQFVFIDEPNKNSESNNIFTVDVSDFNSERFVAEHDTDTIIIQNEKKKEKIQFKEYAFTNLSGNTYAILPQLSRQEQKLLIFNSNTKKFKLYEKPNDIVYKMEHKPKPKKNPNILTMKNIMNSTKNFQIGGTEQISFRQNEQEKIEDTDDEDEEKSEEEEDLEVEDFKLDFQEEKEEEDNEGEFQLQEEDDDDYNEGTKNKRLRAGNKKKDQIGEFQLQQEDEDDDYNEGTKNKRLRTGNKKKDQIGAKYLKKEESEDIKSNLPQFPQKGELMKSSMGRSGGMESSCMPIVKKKKLNKGKSIMISHNFNSEGKDSLKSSSLAGIGGRRKITSEIVN